MKKLISILLMYQGLHAAVGCMDNSYHADPCVRYDYKNYHYVCCSCRCDRYAHGLDRGKCRHCAHYRVPEPLKIKGMEFQRPLPSFKKKINITKSSSH